MAEAIIKAALDEEELEKKKRKRQKEKRGKEHESRQHQCNIDIFEQYDVPTWHCTSHPVPPPMHTASATRADKKGLPIE